MGAVTKIEWCHHTFNPWWGCTQVNRLCDHCYAMMLDTRWFKRAHWGPGAARRYFNDEYWAQPWSGIAAEASRAHGAGSFAPPWPTCSTTMLIRPCEIAFGD